MRAVKAVDTTLSLPCQVEKTQNKAATRPLAPTQAKLAVKEAQSTRRVS